MATSAKMYKFIKGKYKKYFALGNNCVKLADEIISKSGIDALKIYGIITPGAYYEYLNREFRKKNSIVVSRKIYNKKSIKKVSWHNIINVLLYFCKSMKRTWLLVLIFVESYRVVKDNKIN